MLASRKVSVSLVRSFALSRDMAMKVELSEESEVMKGAGGRG